MKKVIKSLFVFFLIIIGMNNVNAKIEKKFEINNLLKITASEKDPDNLIGFPYMVWNNEGDITIDDSITDYTMYYQWIELSEAQTAAIDNAWETYENTFDEIDAEADKLYTNYEAKYKIYKDLYDSGTATEDQLETAYAAAEAEYEIYSNYYNTKSAELENLLDAYYATIPNYTDKWIKAEGTHFKGDFSNFSDERKFVLWIKVDYSEKTLYDFGILTVNGTYEENDEDETSTDEDKNNVSNNDGANVEAPKDDTVESPKTGLEDYIIVIVGGILIAGGTFYYLNKKNLIKKI